MNNLCTLIAGLSLLATAATAQLAPAPGQTGTLPGFGLGAMPGNEEPAPSKVSLSALSSVQAYETGKAFYIAAEAQIEAPWHAYFRNPGSTGLPTELSLQAPEGFRVEGPYWQLPHRVEGLYTSYAYEQKAIVIWKLTPEASAPAEATFRISGMTQLCCETGCDQPTDINTELSLTRGTAAPNPDWQDREKHVEVLGDSPLNITATQNADSVTLTINGAGTINNAYFFSNDSNIAPQLVQ